jgi:bla regulator protein BlaR1
MIPSHFQALANHLWQSTLFAAAAALLTLFLRNNRAQTRYCLWLAASVKFLIPFSILVAAGTHFRSHNSMPIPQSSLSSAFEQASQPFADTTPLASLPATTSRSWILPAILFTAWAIGFVTLVCSWWLRWRRVQQATRAASPINLPIGIEVISSPEFFEPGIFGIFKPVLLLPEGIISHLTPPQMEAILTHELCHVRRRDNLATAIHMAVEALFWFHPLVWWLGARLMDERERACDEEVLRVGNWPEAYAEGILKICELYLESPLDCIAGVTGANLKKRIEAIMNNRIVHNLNGAKKLLLAGAGMFAIAVPILVGVVNTSFIEAQSQLPAGALKFEVASVKRCAGPRPGNVLSSSPGRLTVNCGSVGQLILQAYTRRGANGRPLSPPLTVRIEGGPAWINSDRYEINAKGENDATWQTMLGPMMQALLEDRFKLKLHRETREIPAYGLTLSKSDVKLRQLEENNCIPFDFTKPFDPTAPFVPPAPPQPGQKPPCKGISMGGSGQTQSYTVTAQGATLDQLTALYPIALDRPVVNKTGITGVFTFHLEFAMDVTTNRLTPPAGDAPPASDPGPSIFTVLESQLGLKLEKSTGPAQYLIIDSLERPSEN